MGDGENRRAQRNPLRRLEGEANLSYENTTCLHFLLEEGNASLQRLREASAERLCLGEAACLLLSLEEKVGGGKQRKHVPASYLALEALCLPALWGGNRLLPANRGSLGALGQWRRRCHKSEELPLPQSTWRRRLQYLKRTYITNHEGEEIPGGGEEEGRRREICRLIGSACCISQVQLGGLGRWHN